MNFALALDVALAKRQRSQQWLSEKLGVTSGAIATMRRNSNPTVNKLNDVCEALEMKVSEFAALGEEE